MSRYILLSIDFTKWPFVRPVFAKVNFWFDCRVKLEASRNIMVIMYGGM
jgi:hypothetical protein